MRTTFPRALFAILLWSLFVSAASAGMEEGLRALRVADYEAAYREFLPLAQQGDPIAQYYVGNLYRDGRAVPIDGAEARRWYQRSGEQGYAPAQSTLAALSFQGIGGPRDERQAHLWAERAAAQGSSFALSNLGSDYMVGRGGVAQDPLRAYVYYTLATMHGLPGERTPPNAAEFRQLARSRLSMSDLARAEEMVRAWQPKPEVSPRAAAPTAVTPPPAPAPPASASTAPKTLPTPGTPVLDTSGSGFVVSRRGHVLTNHHVVADCREIRAGVSSEQLRIATLVTGDGANDLALLRLPDAGSAVATFRDGRGIRPGDGVVVVGYPLRGLLASGANVTTGTVSALAGILDDSRLLQVTAPIQPGNSGGPLLDLSGNVVGVIVARALLDANNVNYETSASIRTLSAADVSERAREYTVVVECWK